MAKLLPFTCFICKRYFHHFNSYMGHIRKHKRWPWSVNFLQRRHIKRSNIGRHKLNECFQKTTQDHTGGSCLPPRRACVKSKGCRPTIHNSCGEKLNNHMLKESIHSTNSMLSGSENKDSSTCHQAGSYRCDYCVESFTKLDKLAQHMEIHIDEYVSCLQCGKSFQSEKAREKHLTSVHKQENDRYEQKNDRQKPKHKCSHCCKRFCSTSALRIHSEVHKCFRTCTQCGKHFFYKSHFEQHTYLEKCLLCNESFTCKTAKVSHLKSAAHVNRLVKRYICNQCGENLCNASALQNHTRPGQNCPKCDASFTCTSARDNHMIKYSHHDAVKCKDCGKSFPQRIMSLRHHCKLECTECHKRFKSRRSLLQHSRMHTFPLKCTQCNRRFEKKLSLDRHVMRLHTCNLPSIYKCTQCENSFTSQSALDSHMRIHKYPNKCTHCNESFPRKSTLASHMKIHKNVDEISSKKINRISVKRSNLRKHTRGHARDRPFTRKCTQCEKSFNSKKTFIWHKYTRKCTHCSEHFTCKSTLNNHMKMHQYRETHGQKHMCGKCGTDFVSKSDLDEHEKAIHMQVHTCSQCGKCFKQKYSLRVHEQTHNELKPHQCNECGACFKDKSALSRHVSNMHSNTFPHLCSHCGKSFKAKWTLKTHELTHIDPKQTELYLCIHCGKGFNIKSRLTMHERSHTKPDVEPHHQCIYCGKLFFRMNALILHEQVHTNKGSQSQAAVDVKSYTPLSCSYCGKGFFAKAKLTVHERAHTKPFRCFTCGACYSCKPSLKKHIIASKHTDKYEEIFKEKPHAKATKAVVKPHVCTTCEKRFSHPTSLHKHIAKVHIENKPYSCTMCPSRFHKKHGLHIHMRCHSGLN